MPINLGCNRCGVEQGGKCIREYNLNNIFSKNHILDTGDIPCISYTESYYANDKMRNLENILKSDSLLADKVTETLSNGNFPLIFGGDHSLTWGSLSGVSQYYGTDIGCIYLDAHGDFNSADTSPSGNVHGMHMYYLMGYGDKALVDFHKPGGKIKHENVFFLGTRSLDYGEQNLAQKEKFNIISSSTIRTFGVKKVFQQLVKLLEAFKFIHFSLDIDCIDPTIAPGTGVPEPNGLTFEDAIYLVENILATGKVVSMDLVEFNPLLDSNDKTLQICIDLLKCIDNNLK